MLFLNDVFEMAGRRHRLLYVAPGTQTAWTIELRNEDAWPIAREWRAIRSLDAIDPQSNSVPKEAISSSAAVDKRDVAVSRLAPLVEAVPRIFDPVERSKLVLARARELPCSRTTLYRDLRRWWRGGQTPSALLPSYRRNYAKPSREAIGPARDSNGGQETPLPVTELRGRPGRTATYQLTTHDLYKFDNAVRRHYLADGRVSMRQSYQRLLERNYTADDGNGDPFILGPGERPTFRQFEHYVYSRYRFETRLRKRKGDKDYEREHRAKVGTVLADCLGVGHYYEADATIADVYLVASADVRQIIGKPTIYMIVDRKSRLITGFYVGLENPSWICAMQAILSITEDKALLCKRYGVPYEPNDWPAHGVFPKEFLADRGELLTHASTQLADELAVTVTNVPAKRPDWKPVVESGFRLQRRALEDGTPGFDPPENAKKRQGRKYFHDACLTLEQFTGIILNAVIAHNRSPMLQYDRSLKEIGDGVEPTPLALWNHGIQERAGLLSRYDEQLVRMALLPRSPATVTEEGITLNHCVYICPAAIAGGWLVEARRKRFKVVAIYDRRSVDILYVQNPHKRDEIHACTLTPKSSKFRGMSVAEVEGIYQLEGRQRGEHAQVLLQKTMEMHAHSDAQVAKAVKALKEATRTSKPSRSARRADTKVARQAELRDERSDRLSSQGSTPITKSKEDGKVLAVQAAPRESVRPLSVSQTTECSPPAPPALPAILKVSKSGESTADALTRLRAKAKAQTLIQENKQGA